MKKLMNLLLPIYISLNVIYILIGSILVTKKIMEMATFSKSYIILLIINIIVSIILFIRKKYKKNIIDMFLIIIVITSIISAIFAYNPKKALFGEWGRYEGLFTILYYLSILFISSFVKKKHKKIIIYTMLFSGLVSLSYAICQKLGLFNIKLIIHDGDVWATGFSVNPNFFGALMIICLSYSIGLFIESKKIITKIIHILLVVLFYSGLLISNTLSALVGLLFILLFLIIYSIKNKCFNKYLFLILILLLCSITLNKYKLTFVFGDLLKTKNETVEIAKGNIDDDFGTGRIEIWRKTIKFIPRYLLHGVGIDNFANIDNGKYIQRGRYLYDKAHNEYLQILITEGLFCLLSYMCLHFFIIKNSIKDTFKNKEIYLLLPILGYLVQAMFSISVIEVAPLFYIALGLAVNRFNKEV